jgi:hypothetical protein
MVIWASSDESRPAQVCGRLSAAVEVAIIARERGPQLKKRGCRGQNGLKPQPAEVDIAGLI